MRDLESLNPQARKAISRSYRTINLKTTAVHLIPDVAAQLAAIDGARVAYCPHHQDGFVDHIHLVAQFPSPQHVAKILLPIAQEDICFYLRPCRLFRSSYRYLAHLDNPEKHRVDIRTIVHLGDWDGTDLAQWQASRLTTVTMHELLFLARDYLRDCKRFALAPCSIGFAIYLDSHLVSSRSALSGLRMMGITVSELFAQAETVPDNSNQLQTTDNHDTDD